MNSTQSTPLDKSESQESKGKRLQSSVRMTSGLFLILMVAAAVRFPGVYWMESMRSEAGGRYELAEAGASYNIDENTFIYDTENFYQKSSRGYVRGLTTHYYVIHKVALKWLNQDLNLVVLGRYISLVYGLLTILLLGWHAYQTTSSVAAGLLSAAFLALSPLHVVYSHFGTADSAATFFLLLSAFLAWYSVRHKSELAFVLYAASLGVCLAIKFFVAAFAPLALVLLSQDRRIYHGLQALLVASGSFALTSFFNYTPWDFALFYKMLVYDNVLVLEGKSLWRQAIDYFHSVFSSLGLACGFLMVVGIIQVARHAFPALRRHYANHSLMKLLGHPHLVFLSPFLLQAFLVISMDVTLVRHTLPFVPVLCLAAALGMKVMLERWARPQMLPFALLIPVLGYQAYNAWGSERTYSNDIREDARQWLEENVKEPGTVTAFYGYSDVLGRNHRLSAPQIPGSTHPAEFVVTCDLEYERYLTDLSEEQIWHCFGGKPRLEFFRDLFAGRGGYELVKEFVRQNYNVEQRLARMGWMTPIHDWVPGRCLIFRRASSAGGIAE